jgi:hypothetical protein
MATTTLADPDVKNDFDAATLLVESKLEAIRNGQPNRAHEIDNQLDKQLGEAEKKIDAKIQDLQSQTTPASPTTSASKPREGVLASDVLLPESEESAKTAETATAPSDTQKKVDDLNDAKKAFSHLNRCVAPQFAW